MKALLLFLLVTQILSVLSLFNINDMKFKIIDWSSVGPFPEKKIELVLPNENVTNRIVIIIPGPWYNSASYMEPFKKRIEDFAQRGCLGVLTSSRNFMASPGFIKHGAYVDDFPIPVGLVPYQTLAYYKTLQERGEVPTITFEKWDRDEWVFYFTGAVYYILIGIPIVLFIINLIYSGYLLKKWSQRQKKIEMNIALICLSLEFIGSLIKIFQMILSPLHANFKLRGLDSLTTLPFFIPAITSIVVIFFWLDLTRDHFYGGKFLGIMKIPASIIIFICLLIEIIFGALRGTTDKIDFIIPHFLFYIVIHFMVIMFNFIAGYHILKNLKKPSVRTKERLAIIIRRVIASGIASIIGFIIMIGSILAVNYTPSFITTCWFFLQVSLFVQSLLLITIFQIPKEKKIGECSSSSSVEDKKSSDTKEETTKEIKEREEKENTMISE